MLRKSGLSILVVAISLGLVGFSQTRIDDLRRETLQDELLYIPSKAILKHLTAGMSNVVADMLWVETIQYTVKEFHDPERKFRWLEHMLNAAVDLDPYFEGVYVNGGTFLSSIGADDRAMNLLEKGFIRNPESWRIPMEMVRVYVLNRRDDPGSAAAAVYYLRMVAERHEHPELYLNWARQIQETDDLAGQSRDIWNNMIATAEDPFVRELAEHNLQILNARDVADALQDSVEQFQATYHRPPRDLRELVTAGLVPGLPDPDKLGAFFLDGTGAVQSMIVLQDKRERMLLYLNSRVRILEDEHGRYPRNLDEFIEWDGEPLPPYPIPGKNWAYNPATGEIS